MRFYLEIEMSNGEEKINAVISKTKPIYLDDKTYYVTKISSTSDLLGQKGNAILNNLYNHFKAFQTIIEEDKCIKESFLFHLLI